MDWKYSWTSWLLAIICIQLFLISESSSHLQFADWAKPCKIPSLDPSEFLKPHEECDTSKGQLCQRFNEGPLCGCQIGGTLTYDRKTGECRRRVGAPCHVPRTNEDFAKLSFNHKCHEDALCTKLNATDGSQNSKKDKDAFMCRCKPGFVAVPDFSACVDPNGAVSLRGDFFQVFVFIPVLTLTTYFYR